MRPPRRGESMAGYVSVAASSAGYMVNSQGAPSGRRLGSCRAASCLKIGNLHALRTLRMLFAGFLDRSEIRSGPRLRADGRERNSGGADSN